MDANCTIIIPNYNGKELLAECLPSMMEAVRRRGMRDEVLLVDNASSDGSAEYAGENFPEVRILRLSENRAIFAVNDGAKAAKNGILLLLNNDMAVAPDFITPLLSHFTDDAVFAVTGKVLQWDRATVQSYRRTAVYTRGYYWYRNDYEAPDGTGLTAHALGGQSAYDREKFLALGGFDPLFSPFYHEDLDVTYRAYKRGWKAVYEPGSVMYHRGAATAGKLYSRRELKILMKKNLFLFIWKNIHDPALWAEHWFYLAPRLAVSLARGDTTLARGLLMALPSFPQAMARRAAARGEALVSDRDALGVLMK